MPCAARLRKISVIFSNASLIESEKERNLCTKFFAGYFFNEFTAGYAKRIVQFNRYIQEVTGHEDLGIQSPHISFDTHAYLCHERLRSKLADVVISDPARQVFLFIETKYLSNWTYAADVAKGLERLDKVFDADKKPHLADARQHYFVLTSRRKEEAAGRPVQHYAPVNGSVYVPPLRAPQKCSKAIPLSLPSRLSPACCIGKTWRRCVTARKCASTWKRD